MCQLGIKKKTAEGHSFAELKLYFYTQKTDADCFNSLRVLLHYCYLFKSANEIFHPEHLDSSCTLSIRSLWSLPGMPELFPEVLDLMLSSGRGFQ